MPDYLDFDFSAWFNGSLPPGPSACPINMEPFLPIEFVAREAKATVVRTFPDGSREIRWEIELERCPVRLYEPREDRP